MSVHFNMYKLTSNHKNVNCLDCDYLIFIHLFALPSRNIKSLIDPAAGVQHYLVRQIINKAGNMPKHQSQSLIKHKVANTQKTCSFLVASFKDTNFCAEVKIF